MAINTRIQMKSDTTANWETKGTFVPLKGEIIVYTDMEPIGIKVGNGTSQLSNIRFSTLPSAGDEGAFVRVLEDGSYGSENITLIDGGSSVNIVDVSLINAEGVSF